MCSGPSSSYSFGWQLVEFPSKCTFQHLVVVDVVLDFIESVNMNLRIHRVVCSSICFRVFGGGLMNTLTTWTESVLGSLTGMSRTLGGTSDTTSSAEKPKLGCSEGEALASRTERNLRQALLFLWANRARQFESAAEVREFVDKVAEIVSDGLLTSGQSLYRTWETKFGQTSVAEIETEYRKFCEWLFGALEKLADSVETAALVEYRLDGHLHPFADGCGRTAKVLAAFVLLRGHRTPPRYGARKEYYRKINESEAEWILYYRSLCETPRMAS